LDFECVSRRTVCRWFESFRADEMGLEAKEAHGRSSTIKNDKMEEIINVDPYKITQKVAEKLVVDQATIVPQLKELEETKKLDYWDLMNLANYKTCIDVK